MQGQPKKSLSHRSNKDCQWRGILRSRQFRKRHEEFWRGTLQEAWKHYGAIAPKGEFTLIVAGVQPKQPWLSEEANLKTERYGLSIKGYRALRPAANWLIRPSFLDGSCIN
ncbi:MAG: hypothetical protein AAGF66_10680 [Cyanobacteria bacterium P01_H01_bin.119]